MKVQKKCECHNCTQARASGRTSDDKLIEERRQTDEYIRKRKTEKTIMHLNETVDRLTQINARLAARISELEFEKQNDKLTADRIDRVQRPRPS